MKNRTLHGSEKIWILCSRGENDISLAVLTREVSFLILEHKMYIVGLPCNILYISRSTSFNNWLLLFAIHRSHILMSYLYVIVCTMFTRETAGFEKSTCGETYHSL